MIRQIKESFNKNIREILDVSLAMERGNSIIINENILNDYSEIPVLDIKEENGFIAELTKDIKEDIEKKFPSGIREGQSLILSMLSILDERKGVRNHIVSLEIEENKGINFNINITYLEEELNVSSLFIRKIKNSHKLSETLDIIIYTFMNKAERIVKNRFEGENYKEFSINKKLEYLKDLMSNIYGNNHKIDDLSYLFFVDDLNIKNSLYNHYLKVKNQNYINKNLYDTYLNKLLKNKYKLNKLIVNFDDNKLISDSQKTALKEINNNINLIIGTGGSGKTYLASLLSSKYLTLHAIASTTKNKIPSMYTTYSKYSLIQYLKYCSDFEHLIYRKDFNVIQNRITKLEESIDKDRYNNIKIKLSKYDISNINQNIKKENEVSTKIGDVYRNSLDETTYTKIKKLLNYLKKEYKEPSFIDKILQKIGIKDIETIIIPNNYSKPLELKGIKIPSNINMEKVPNVIRAIHKRDINKQIKVEKSITTINSEFDNTPETLSNFDISIEDVAYYLNFQPIVENPDKKTEYINMLKDLSQQIKSEKNIKIDFDLFQDMFPLVGDSVTNILPFNYQFANITVDESILVPGYFFPAIMSKSNNIISFADINQLELSQNFYPNVNSILDRIYKNDNKYIKLTVKENFGQKSFYDHLEQLIGDNNLFVLTDNFRNNEKIYKLAREISNSKYDHYFGIYKDKHNINLKIEEMTHHYGEDNTIFQYAGETFNTPFLFADAEDNKRYENILSLLAENRISQNDVMIIVPFKQHIEKVRKHLNNSNIIIDVIENVQGVEKKVIIFDWFAGSTIDEGFKYMDKRKFNLIVTRAKSMFITIGNKEFLFKNQIEDLQDNGYFIISKYLRNNKYDIYEIK